MNHDQTMFSDSEPYFCTYILQLCFFVIFSLKLVSTLQLLNCKRYFHETWYKYKISDYYAENNDNRKLSMLFLVGTYDLNDKGGALLVTMFLVLFES